MEKAIKKYWPIFVVPTVAAFCIGFLWPFLQGLYLSLCKFTTLKKVTFVGFENFKYALTDPEFAHAFWFTAAFTVVSTIFINVIAFTIALILTQMCIRDRDYMEMAQLYKSAIREITTKLEVLDSEFSVRYDHNPIHHIDNRLKSIASIVEKLRRKGAAVSIENAKAYLTDIAGVRVVCNYIDDIYRIADMLCAQDDIVVLRRTDYIENPKENGYRSLHLVLSLSLIHISGRNGMPPAGWTAAGARSL